MKIWICEDGEYSGRHLVAAFSDQAAAENAAEICGWDVTGLELDEHKPDEWPAGKRPWCLTVRPDEGRRDHQLYATQGGEPPPVGEVAWRESSFHENGVRREYASACVWAASHDEALQIAADKCRAMGVEPRAR